MIIGTWKIRESEEFAPKMNKMQLAAISIRKMQKYKRDLDHHIFCIGFRVRTIVCSHKWLQCYISSYNM